MTKENMEEPKNNDENLYFFAGRKRGLDGVPNIDGLINSMYRPKKLNASSIKRLMDNPFVNAEKLQDISKLAVIGNGILKEFINYKSLILTNDHFIFPTDITKYKSKEELWKDELKVANYIELYNIKSLNRNITRQILTNGEIYIYKRETKNGILMQEIPSKMCKITSLDEYGVYRFGINMNLINENTLDFFPPEIVDAWKKYKRAKDKKNLNGYSQSYYLVGEDGAAFHLSGWEKKGLPYYTHLFTALNMLDEAENIDDLNNKLNNYKLLFHKAPINKDGKILMSEGLVSAYHESIKGILPPGVGVVTTPMDLSSISLGDANLKNYEYTNNVKKTIYDNAGISDELFNGNTNNKESVLLSAIVDTLVPIEIQGMIEIFFNRELRKKFKKGNWRLSFVPTSYYNKNNEVKSERENQTLYGSKKKYLATQGFTPLQSLSILLNEEMLKIEEKMLPMQTSHTLGGDKGRPEKDINDGDELNG